MSLLPTSDAALPTSAPIIPLNPRPDQAIRDTVTEGPAPPLPEDPNADKRVLHVVNGEHYSGAERVQDLLALALPEFGYSVGFASLKAGKFGDYRRSVDSPLHEIEMRGYDRQCDRQWLLSGLS